MRRSALPLLVALAACSDGAACPEGSSRDDARTARVGRLLRTDAEGDALWRGVADATVCWGREAEPGVREHSAVLLQEALTDQEAAALLGHLLLHLREGLPMAEGCAGLVRAREQEQRAHELEDRLRARFGAPPLAAGALDATMAAYHERCRR